jgi:hypothetical protein
VWHASWRPFRPPRRSSPTRRGHSFTYYEDEACCVRSPADVAAVLGRSTPTAAWSSGDTEKIRAHLASRAYVCGRALGPRPPGQHSASRPAWRPACSHQRRPRCGGYDARSEAARKDFDAPRRRR